MSATCNKPPPPHARAASTHSTLLRKGETRVKAEAIIPARQMNSMVKDEIDDEQHGKGDA